MREKAVLRLNTGEKFVADVPLLGTVPRDKQGPGVYKVQAFYEYAGGTAVSDPVEVAIPG